MQKFNTDAYGEILYVNFNEDISTGTAFTLELDPQEGNSIDKTPTLGTSDVDVGDQTYLANQYVKWTTTSDVFQNYIGLWRAKATATLPTKTLATDFILFRVTA